MPEVGLVFDERFKQHDTGPGHPERPARLDAVRAGLEWWGHLAGCTPIDFAEIERELLTKIHDAAYVDRVRAACESGVTFIDSPDSAVCPASYRIGLLAAGAAVAAARAVGRGEVSRAFCALRPPGHHAERGESMGFCLFNNVALAAHVLRHEAGIPRVAIVDWDVHHGNGTQHIFEADPSVLFISLHGHPQTLYPGTGFEHEKGTGEGAGFTLNIPMMPGATDADYHRAFAEQVIPALDHFAPGVILISAGFDAHENDPLASICLTDAAFASMLRELLAVARRHCHGRVVSILEGGYNLEVLRNCVAEHVRILREE